MIKKLSNFLFGYSINHEIEHKFLLMVPLTASVIMALFVPVYIYYQSLPLILVSAIGTFVFLGAYLLIRHKNFERIASWIIVIYAGIISNFIWFYFEGSKGPSIELIFTILICAAIYFRKIEMLLSITLILLDLAILLFIEHKYPKTIIPFPNNLERLFSILINSCISGFFILYFVFGILKSYYQKKIEAETVEKLKTKFLRNISQEIKAPINSIMGFSLLIEESDLDEFERKNYCEYIVNSCNGLVNLIEGIANFTEIESKEQKVNKTASNVNDTLYYIYHYFTDSSQKLLNENIEFKLNKKNLKHDIQIMTDPAHLKQILINLIKNALKFTNSGRVEYGIKRNKNHVIFYVKDTGIGIPKERHYDVFKGFTKYNTQQNISNEGIGLGLTISKNLTELLGGKIWFKSEVNKGSTFYFSIPRN